MISARQSVVQEAVRLINPDEDRRVECHNAVHVSLTNVSGYAKDLQRVSEIRGKLGKRANDRLHKALQDVQKRIQDPSLSNNLRKIISTTDLARAIELVNEERTKTGFRRFPYKAHKKLDAANAAYHLLRQFNRKISAEKGSVFCKLAAVLCGESPARLQWTCRVVVSLAKSAAVLSPKN